MMIALLIAAGVSVTPAAAAEPRSTDVEVTVTLEWAYRPRPRVAVDGILWLCQGNRCSARLADTPAAVERACYRFASRVGRVLSLEGLSAALDEEALARCNRNRR
ncbi:CC_3452 family protein [Sphingosinicella terrae]|uniref:CC_3452 family protein n=1 Tax=Sphingosinicella terrae TaxID=2172047 RepID=UPI0013B405E2|nr:hypothetical protein [Sphingosinicella terrae]